MQPIVLVAGARPNFMKVAPLADALARRGATTVLVHTGQHYDAAMSDVFFRDLGLRAPDRHLGVGPGDRQTQTRKIILGLHETFRETRPSSVVVVGDVTSTAAGAIAGTVAGIPVAHVEAGLRSFNWRMPEELNRMIADHHSALLFATEEAAIANLRAERVPDERVKLVGNVMIDTLMRMLPLAGTSTIHAALSLVPRRYSLATLHRPENVDDPARFRELWRALTAVASRIPIVFPMHPRTRARLDALSLAVPEGLRLVEPIGYLDMLALSKDAAFIMTDSGGVPEEATILGVPCLTIRTETERPVTVTVGTNEVVGVTAEAVIRAAERARTGEWKRGGIPALWDGHAAERIADILLGI